MKRRFEHCASTSVQHPPEIPSAPSPSGPRVVSFPTTAKENTPSKDVHALVPEPGGALASLDTPAHPAHPSPAGAQGMLLGLEVVWGWCPSVSSAGTILWCLTHSLVTLCSPRASKPGSFTTNSLSAPLLVLNPKGIQRGKHLG